MNDSLQADRHEFSREIGGHNLVPLWERPHPTRTPVSPAKPAYWDYDGVVRPFIMRAGGLITAKEAERRVLVLENPGLRGQYRIIPVRLTIDTRPLPGPDGADAIWIGNQPIPRGFAGFENVVIGVPHLSTQFVLPQIVPDPLHRIQFR
jgi:hypothetical protein